MTNKNRRPGKGDGFGLQLFSRARSHTTDASIQQHLSDGNGPGPIIRAHLRDDDLDGAVWCRNLALAAADWLADRRAA
jgi:hypothetical protein